MSGLGFRVLLLSAALGAVFATGAQARDYEAGKQKAEGCKMCHGPEGNAPLMPEAPRLAGQYYDYLVHSLEAYRKGSRDNPVMSMQAKPLTDTEIRDLAWYFSKQQGLTVKY